MCSLFPARPFHISPSDSISIIRATESVFFRIVGGWHFGAMAELPGAGELVAQNTE